MGKVLANAHHNLCFDQSAFVIAFLANARTFGKDVLESAISSIYRSGVTGVRSGAPGEPFDRDLNAKASSEAVLSTLALLSPAHRLYDLIKRSAERDIASSLRDRELFEDT